MEKFDINKEMAKLKGLNIIEKCSALDDLLDETFGSLGDLDAHPIEIISGMPNLMEPSI